MDSKTFENVWEVISITLAFVSLLGLVVLPVFFTRLAFKYTEAVKEKQGLQETKKEGDDEIWSLFSLYKAKKTAHGEKSKNPSPSLSLTSRLYNATIRRFLSYSDPSWDQWMIDSDN